MLFHLDDFVMTPSLVETRELLIRSRIVRRPNQISLELLDRELGRSTIVVLLHLYLTPKLSIFYRYHRHFFIIIKKYISKAL